jgi:prevent-host-death family protein
MAYEVPVTQARAEFADLVNRVVYGGERVVVTRHGKPIVALVPAADLDRLEDDEQQRPATVVRLSTDAPVQSIQTDPPARRHLDIAAEHRPPGGNSGSSPRQV